MQTLPDSAALAHIFNSARQAGAQREADAKALEELRERRKRELEAFGRELSLALFKICAAAGEKPQFAEYGDGEVSFLSAEPGDMRVHLELPWLRDGTVTAEVRISGGRMLTSARREAFEAPKEVVAHHFIQGMIFYYRDKLAKVSGNKVPMEYILASYRSSPDSKPAQEQSPLSISAGS